MTNHDSKPEARAVVIGEFGLPIGLLTVPEVELVTSSYTTGEPDSVAVGIAPASRPGDLPYQLTRAYDLSVSKAIEASIPVIGSGAMGAQRRVIVLERVGYEKVPKSNGGVDQTGFAIRLCITINKLDANVKMSLPFITASAQLGSTEATWTMQIVGLSGPKIAAVEIVPTELSVETFVIAKQSLQALIDALSDDSTQLNAKVIAHEGPPSSLDERYAPIIAQAAALASIARGWSMQEAASRYSWDLSAVPSSFATVYQDVAGINSVTVRPVQPSVGTAARILANVRVRPD